MLCPVRMVTMVSLLSMPFGRCCTQFDIVQASPSYEKEGKTCTGGLLNWFQEYYTVAESRLHVAPIQPFVLFFVEYISFRACISTFTTKRNK